MSFMQILRDALTTPWPWYVAGPLIGLFVPALVLLDDARRYVERAVAAGVDARLDVWEGVPHGFLSGIGRLAAAGVLDAIGAFLAERLAVAR